MSPETAALISRMQAMPKAFAVVTRFADGAERRHETATEGQANNYAVGERRKVGRDLISRETGAAVRVVSVDVVKL